MRGEAPIPGLHTFRITGDGVQVFPGSLSGQRRSRDPTSQGRSPSPETGSRSA